MNKRWNMRQVDLEAGRRLAESLELPPLLGRLLLARGVSGPEEGRRYLNGGLDDLHSPWGLSGMEAAVERLLEALRRRQKVTVYGDYDVDGVTSTALLLKAFAALGLEADFYIPDRLKEGYGPNIPALEARSRGGSALVVTVDCGINSVAEARRAAELGLDLVVTDHHVEGPELPGCLAVINPKVSPRYPYSMLAGVGVAYKLAQALLEKAGLQERAGLLEECLELVALGTVCDVAPLDGENRVLAREGIRRMRATRFVGLECLCQVAGLEPRRLDSTALGFALGPRLNAGGRIGDPKLGVRLLLSRSRAEAMDMARALDAENRQRQAMERSGVEEAKRMARERLEATGDKVLVLASPDWHPGVVGLMASRVTEAFTRPSLVLSLHEGLAKGSARSRRPFHMVRALEQCGDLLLRFGGHEFAAGLTLEPGNIEALRLRMNRLADDQIGEEDLQPSLTLDLALSFTDLTPGLMKDLGRLSPFGSRNPRPLFAAFDCRLLPGTRAVGADNLHLKLSARQSGRVMPGIAFRMGPDLAALDLGRPVDLAFELGWNDYMGQRTLQLEVRDIRQDGPGQERKDGE